MAQHPSRQLKRAFPLFLSVKYTVRLDAQLLRLLICALHSSSQALVRRCFVNGPAGAAHFCTGTGEGPVLNAGVIPTDCQTWTALSGVAPDVRDACLDYVVANHQATSAGFLGMRFSSTGREVQNENTAGAALALREAGRAEAGSLLASLQDQVSGGCTSAGRFCHYLISRKRRQNRSTVQGQA